jgi:hypothetical protein
MLQCVCVYFWQEKVAWNFFIQCKEEYISTQLVAWFTKFYQPSKTFPIYGTKEYCQTQKYKLETKLHPIKKSLF